MVKSGFRVRDEVGNAECVILGVFHFDVHLIQVIRRDLPHFGAQFIEDGDDLANVIEFLLGVGSDVAARAGHLKHLVYLALLKTELTGDDLLVLAVGLQTSGLAHFVITGDFTDSICSIFRSIMMKTVWRLAVDRCTSIDVLFGGLDLLV